ncbi:MAG: hypothetical protein MI921_25175 [Cytophagales bacterium]|nr:hypothetical protein [Cytophagales bacterium]
MNYFIQDHLVGTAFSGVCQRNDKGKHKIIKCYFTFGEVQQIVGKSTPTAILKVKIIATDLRPIILI